MWKSVISTHQLYKKEIKGIIPFIRVSKNKILKNKLKWGSEKPVYWKTIKHWWKKLNGKIFSIHGS